MQTKNYVRVAVILTAIVCLFWCTCGTTEDVFLLEVEPYRHVKTFEYMGDMSSCPLLKEDFMRAARAIVDLNELDGGRFWVRAEDFSVLSFYV